MVSAEVRENGKNCCKTCCRVSFSHIGLCLLVFLYMAIGAFLFPILESQNEIWACQDSQREYVDMENEAMETLLEIVMNNSLGSHIAMLEMEGLLETFRNNSLAINYDGRDCARYGQQDGPQHEWNWAGAFVFCVTVVTTIGYGHIFPKTAWGRLMCISYAMIGIPLMLIFLANIGDSLANVFRFFYAQVLCLGCLKSEKKEIRKQPSQTPETGQSTSTERMSRPETDTMSPPGIENDVRRTSSPLDLSSNGSQVTHRLVARQLSSQSIQPLTQQSKMADRKSSFLVIENVNGQHHDDDDDDDEDAYWEKLLQTPVPLTVAMFIIGLYILGGGFLFKYWESWELDQSSYFCFITLSSIGFGDLSPGTQFKDVQANFRMIAGCFYTIFGMAILSMCFSLVQDEMASKFKWLGEKLGVVEKDPDHDKDIKDMTVSHA